MNMEAPDYDIEKELILSKMDYAIKCVKDLEEHPDYINYSKQGWSNLITLLREIESDIKEY